MFILVRVLVECFDYHEYHKKGELVRILYKDANEAIRTGQVEIVFNRQGENSSNETFLADSQPTFPNFSPVFGINRETNFSDVFDENELKKMELQMATNGYFVLCSGAAEEEYLDKLLPGLTFVCHVADLVDGDPDYDYCLSIFKQNDRFVMSSDAGNTWITYAYIDHKSPFQSHLIYLLDDRQKKIDRTTPVAAAPVEPEVSSNTIAYDDLPWYVAPGHFPWRPHVFDKEIEPSPQEKQYARQINRDADLFHDSRLLSLIHEYKNFNKFSILLGDAEEQYLQALLPNYKFILNIGIEEAVYSLLSHDGFYFTIDISIPGQVTFAILLPGHEHFEQIMAQLEYLKEEGILPSITKGGESIG